MSAPALLRELQQRGITLSATGDKIKFVAPRGAMTPDLKAAVAQHKQELITILNPPPLFRVADGAMDFGDVCHGWSPTSWARELRRKAGCCDQHRPDIADYYRRWAADIEAKLEGAP